MTGLRRETVSHGEGIFVDGRAIVVALVGLAMLLYKLAAQIVVGPAWDSYSFLANAAVFAGQGYGYTEFARPPMISLLISVPMRLGFTHEAVIQVADGALTALAAGALYALMRRRFGQVVSAAGALAFVLSPPVWRWIGVGYTDTAAVGITMLALLFAIKATEDDPRWFYAVPSTLAVAALTRTTSLLFVGVVGVWLLLRARPFRQYRYMLGGVGIAIAAYAPLGWFFAAQEGNPFYPFVASMSIQQAAGAVSGGGGLERPVDSFTRMLPQFALPGPLWWIAAGLMAAAALGLAFVGVRSLRRRAVPAGRLLGAVAVCALGAALVVGRGPLAVVIVAGCAFVVWRLVASGRVPAEGGHVRIVPADWALDATMIAWLVGLLVFHDQWAQKVERYYIAMAPAVIYLVALGAVFFAAEARRLRGVPGFTPRLLWLTGLATPAIVAVALLGAVGLDARDTSWVPDPIRKDAADAASWIRSNGLSEEDVVYSDMWPETAWYLKAPVEAMPTFSDTGAVKHELLKRGATYYVSLRGDDFPGYRLGMRTGTSHVLVASGDPAASRRRVQYLGVGWENYAEELAGFNFFLDHDEGDYNMQGSAYLDHYSLEELERYDVVAVYGARWHDRAVAEERLMEYAERGGTVVLDASANLTQPYTMQDCAIFDTVFTRTLIPPDGRIEVSPGLVERYRELENFRNARFSTEEDPEWYGVTYSELPGSEPFEVLARVDGKPIVAVRRWGTGRVILVGANLLWHAQATNHPDEALLVRAIFEEALVDERLPSSRADVARNGDGEERDDGM